MRADTVNEPTPTSSSGGASPSSVEALFKMSVMLWTLGIDRPFNQRLEEVAEAGFRAVELAGEYRAWSEDDFRASNEKRRELGITFDATAGAVVAPGRWRHNASDPRQREEFLADVRAELRFAEKLECPGLIVLGGELVPGLSPQAQYDSCVETLKRAAELAENRGVMILLENVDLEENPDYVARSVADTFQIVADVDHPQVKVCYDLYHAQITGGNLIANLERHIDQVGKIHIGDVPGHHEPGTGEINFANIYIKLAELGYDGHVAMEFLPTGDPVETLARAREAALLAANS
ncbi:MAG TPA: TIM barrel protein [Solirubrobacteraceae bacterium]|nr:TIM barrel protein [Solirubrobacteraceae bacterium]